MLMVSALRIGVYTSTVPTPGGSGGDRDVAPAPVPGCKRGVSAVRDQLIPRAGVEQLPEVLHAQRTRARQFLLPGPGGGDHAGAIEVPHRVVPEDLPARTGEQRIVAPVPRSVVVLTPYSFSYVLSIIMNGITGVR